MYFLESKIRITAFLFFFVVATPFVATSWSTTDPNGQIQEESKPLALKKDPSFNPGYISGSLGMTSSLGHSDSTNTYGGNLGINAGYYFHPRWSTGLFLHHKATIGVNGGGFNVFSAWLAGIETDYSIAHSNSSSLRLGVRGGYLSANGLSLFLGFLPAGVNSYQNFGMGPKFSVLLSSSKSFSWGFDFSYMQILSGKADTTDLINGSQDFEVSTFGIIDLGIVIMFRI